MSSPRITIIIPAYNVQSYVGECLESVLSQSFDDFEVIAVDDCSPDGSGEVMDEYAARDSRVRVLHLPENVGLGRARNAGLAEARGEYVMFLDSDDTITPGSLELIAARLEATDDPDVIIFDYARTFWWGKVARNALAAVFRSGVPDVFTAKEQPQFMDLFMVVWNKAYRRDFIEAHGFEFPAGYYEDLPWTYPVLMTAERITSLDSIVVHYRQRRQGNILRTVSRKHFDIFDQYKRVWAVIDSEERLGAQWGTWMFASMVEHFLAILHKKSRVPAEARREFFGEISRMYNERVPEGYTHPGGVLGLKHELIRRNQYYVFQTLKVGVETARAARERAYNVARWGKRQLIRNSQWWNLKLPMRKGLAIYSSYWHRSYSCNPAAIHAKALELAPDMKHVWALPKDVPAPPGAKRVIPGSRRYWKALARAQYLINNANFEDELVKRPDSVHVQTHHGTPLKHMGLSMIDYPTAAKGMDFNELLRRCDRWDWSISSNRYSTMVWERAYPAAYRTIESGYPRNDRLINASVDEIREIRADLGISDTTTAVLYAPTHRDYNYGYVPRLDFSRLADELGDDVVLLVRTHYFYAGSSSGGKSKNPRVIDVSEYPSTEDLLLAADVLLTDYSSIVFDYANLDRPVVVYADDWDTYRELRGVYFDFMTDRPGHVVHSQEELIELFADQRADDDDSRKHRAQFRERFCQYDDGKAAERVVRTVMLGEPTDAIAVTPLDDRLSPERRAWDARLRPISR